MFWKKKENTVLSPEQKEAKVSSELAEAQKCVEKADVTCTVQHLREARKHEECPPCKRQIGGTITHIPYLPQEKRVAKVQGLRTYVEGATPLRKLSKEMAAIKPTRTQVLAGKTRSALHSTGRSLKNMGSWLKRRVAKPKEVKT